MRPPRQGDSDEGRALLLDPPAASTWPPLLALAGALIGPLDWWPRPPADAASTLVGALLPAGRQIDGRPARRPWRFPDAGITLLRDPADAGEHEIWCRCDGGPHGFLTIAAHAHADALSVEVRYQAWISSLIPAPTATTVNASGGRTSARPSRTTPSSSAGTTPLSRAAHSCGPARGCPRSRGHRRRRRTPGGPPSTAGYSSLDPPATHRRSVLLDRASRSIDIIDQIEGGRHEVRVRPSTSVRRYRWSSRAPGAILRWNVTSSRGEACLELPLFFRMEPAPRRDRSHPRLVLAWLGSARA